MASSNNNEVISKASPHTIKKFELIEAYTLAWAHKLLQFGKNGNVNGIVFIDCMCNSGVYTDNTGKTVYGTPIRVARILSEIMREQPYFYQQAHLYFNDLDKNKIEELKKHLPADTRNFHIYTSSVDGNDLLKDIGKQLRSGLKMSYLLVYDPYTASIDWEALYPFIRNWGEVIINHMVSDSIRAVPQAKRPEKISKYENTYLTSIEELISFGSDRNAYRQKIEEIINALRGNNRLYIASYPFFNANNALVYDLIHCTHSLAGFKLYKSTSWKTFGGKSATLHSQIAPQQMALFFDEVSSCEEETCYFLKDVVEYIYRAFKGKGLVALHDVWALVDEHPIFPSDLFRKDIKKQLKELGCLERVIDHNHYIDFR